MKTPTTEVLGVVLPGSVRVIEEHDESVTVVFALKPWRRAGEPLVTTKLNAQWRNRLATKAGDHTEKLPAGEAVRARAHLREVLPGYFGADVVDVLGPTDDDRVLGEEADLLRRKTVVEDSFFGWLKQHDGDCFEGRRGDCTFLVTVIGDPPRVPPEAILAAKWLEDTRRRVIDHVAGAMLDLYNNTWRQGSPKKSRREIGAAIAIRTLQVSEKGALVVYFDDGDLFAGHEIELFIDIDRTLGEPHLIG